MSFKHLFLLSNNITLGERERGSGRYVIRGGWLRYSERTRGRAMHIRIEWCGWDGSGSSPPTSLHPGTLKHSAPSIHPSLTGHIVVSSPENIKVKKHSKINLQNFSFIKNRNLKIYIFVKIIIIDILEYIFSETNYL